MSGASSYNDPEVAHEKVVLGKKPTLLRGIYGPYILLPILAACVWLAGLLALIGIWAANGTPRYQNASANVAYISNVGAYHQTLFICICVVTSFFYIASLLSERYLRHVDRIPSHGSRNKREVIYDILAIVFCVLGSTALILLSAFNCYSYPTVHWCCTAIFIVCIAISAVFQTLEIGALKKDHPDRAHLLRNALFKLLVVVVAICLAVAFGVLYSRCTGDYNFDNGANSRCNKIKSAAGVLEWVIAVVFDVYLWTLVLDLWPASKSSPRYLRRLERWEQRGLEKMRIDNPAMVDRRAGAGEPVIEPPVTGRERNGRPEGVPADGTVGGPMGEVRDSAGVPVSTNGQYGTTPVAYPTTANPQYGAPGGRY